MITGYFTYLFTAHELDSGSITRFVPILVSKVKDDILLDRYSEDEVRRAVFGMYANKSSRLDGFNSGFY